MSTFSGVSADPMYSSCRQLQYVSWSSPMHMTVLLLADCDHQAAKRGTAFSLMMGLANVVLFACFVLHTLRASREQLRNWWLWLERSTTRDCGARLICCYGKQKPGPAHIVKSTHSAADRCMNNQACRNECEYTSWTLL